jgi:hypothetical protein
MALEQKRAVMSLGEAAELAAVLRRVVEISTGASVYTAPPEVRCMVAAAALLLALDVLAPIQMVQLIEQAEGEQRVAVLLGQLNRVALAHIEAALEASEDTDTPATPPTEGDPPPTIH